MRLGKLVQSLIQLQLQLIYFEIVREGINYVNYVNHCAFWLSMSYEVEGSMKLPGCLVHSDEDIVSDMQDLVEFPKNLNHL